MYNCESLEKGELDLNKGELIIFTLYNYTSREHQQSLTNDVHSISFSLDACTILVHIKYHTETYEAYTEIKNHKIIPNPARSLPTTNK